MSLQTIKHDFALEFGFKNWNELTEASSKPMLQNHMNDVARRYAKQCVKASLWKAYMAAEVTINGQPAMGGYQVERESIINDENIML